MFLMPSPEAEEAEPPTEDCPFKVVRTNGSDEILARAINLQIGRAAFETGETDVSQGLP
jgi:hypothetical protein